MPVSPSKRVLEIPPYAFAPIGKRCAELNAQGKDVIRLDVGSPDLPPPSQVVEALYQAAQKTDVHGYGGFFGTPALRQAFADYYKRRFEVELDPVSEVLPLLGSKEGLANISFALLDPGDIVIVPDPGYPAYTSGALLAGASTHEVRLDPENNYQPVLDSIPPAIREKARLMWVNYPHNPTGAVASLDELKHIVDFCRQHDIMIASDNPYTEVTFDGVRPPSLLEVDGAKEIAIEFNSLSKMYNMAGWRVGVCVGNATMVGALLSVKTNIDSGLFKVVQEAAVVALTQVDIDWIAERNAVYQRRRDIILGALSDIGLTAEVSRATLYVWARLIEGSDDIAYTEDARNNAYVSLAPGSMYGSTSAGYVRLSVVQTEDRMIEAMARLRSWYNNR